MKQTPNTDEKKKFLDEITKKIGQVVFTPEQTDAIFDLLSDVEKEYNEALRIQEEQHQKELAIANAKAHELAVREEEIVTKSSHLCTSLRLNLDDPALEAEYIEEEKEILSSQTQQEARG